VNSTTRQLTVILAVAIAVWLVGYLISSGVIA
jgi:hypothetical protein